MLAAVKDKRPGRKDGSARVEQKDGGRKESAAAAGSPTQFSGAAIEAMATAHLAPSARVVSDGLCCFRAVTRAGCQHQPIIAVHAPQQPEKIPAFRWVNTVLGNLKTAIAGTLKAVRPRYAFRYLAEFQYRFNRRFDLPAMLDRLACAASRAAPKPKPSKLRTRLGNQEHVRRVTAE